MSSQDKKRGDNVASSRSREEKEKTNTRLKSGGSAQKLPEWAKDLPDEITVKIWEID